ncbi:MAG: MATE family efflux transporter [Gemmatimonadaceae bacterium]
MYPSRLLYPDSFRDELRATLALALPIVVVQVGMMAMGVVDTIMVGHVNATSLAAVAVGNLYFFSLAVFGIGTLMALDPIVAQAVGAGADIAVSRAMQRGLLLAVALSAAVSALLWPGEPLLAYLRQPEDVIPVAAEYARVSIVGVFPLLAFVVLRQSLQAMGRMTPILITVITANILNALLNWVLIYGNLGSPALGAVGSAWSTAISRWLLVIMLMTMGWHEIGKHVKTPRREVFSSGPLWRMLVLGVPIGFQHQLEYGVFAVVAVLMGQLGTTQVAAHQVAINLASLTFMVPLGISAAAAVRAGHAVGRGDPEQAARSAWASLAFGGAFMLLSAFAFIIAPGVLARIYTSDGAVLALAISLIPIAGVFQVFDGLQAVAAGVLRGMGDTRVPLYANLIGFWLVGMPVSLLLGFTAGTGPTGLWWGLVVGLAVVALFLVVRVRSRLAAPLTRVRIDDVVLGIGIGIRD